jgi:hypothetical protein
MAPRSRPKSRRRIRSTAELQRAIASAHLKETPLETISEIDFLASGLCTSSSPERKRSPSWGGASRFPQP